jgi:hypothetical protein
MKQSCRFELKFQQLLDMVKNRCYPVTLVTPILHKLYMGLNMQYLFTSKILLSKSFSRVRTKKQGLQGLRGLQTAVPTEIPTKFCNPFCYPKSYRGYRDILGQCADEILICDEYRERRRR